MPNAPFSTGILFIKTRDHSGNDLVAYYQHNHLQAPLQAIDKQGNIRWAAQYTAFGQTSIISSGDSAINSNLRLPGQYADSESGLYYNWQRYYDPNTGRYISSDPIGLAGGFNRYAYVEGNPVGWVDPSGLNAGTVVGAELGTIIFPGPGTVAGAVIGTIAQVAIVAVISGSLSGDVPHSRDEYDDQNIERISNQREYQNNCDNQKPPSGLDPCEAAKWKLNRAQMCLDSRKANTDKWHNGVDKRHNPQLYQDLERRIQNAQNEVKRECKCP